MTRLLVTGGAGFIGVNFVAYTLQHHPEYAITVLDALTPAAAWHRWMLDELDVEVVVGDVRDLTLVDRLASRTDAIVHLAAESSNDSARLYPIETANRNVIGTMTLLEAVQRHGCRLHHVSTDEVYGSLKLSDETLFDGSQPYRPTTYYSASKAAADHFVRAAWNQFELPVTISISGNNYGRAQDLEKLVPRTVTSVSLGVRPRIFGTGLHVRDWLHVDDHCSAIHAVLRKGQLGESYLVSSRSEATNLDVVQMILRIMGRPEDWIESCPERVGDDARYALDASRSRSDLDWRPSRQDLSEELPDVIDWYKRHESAWRRRRIVVEEQFARLGR